MPKLVYHLLRTCLLLGLLSLGRTGRAQAPAEPPPGGFAPRQVPELTRVPLPPGGLIPFRQGAYWGYADTTGRVWIAPVLEPEPRFFVGDVVQLHGYYLPAFRDSHKRDTFNGRDEPYTRDGYDNYIFWMNAHGEFLAVNGQAGRTEAALLLPGGRLRAGWAAEHVGEPALTIVYVNGQPQVQPVPLPPAAPSEPPRFEPPSRPGYNSLGLGRFAYAPEVQERKLVERYRTGYRENRRGKPQPAYHYRFLVHRSRSQFYALTDSAGHRLTGHVYNVINPFAQGWALATDLRRQRPTTGPGPVNGAGYVLLNRQGRVVPLPDSVVRATDVEQGTVLVWTVRRIRVDYSDREVRDRGGIVDTSGRVLLPLSGRLSEPDELGLLRHAALVDGDSVTRFVTRRAEPALGGRSFRRAGAFYHGRAWAEAADGRQGLIDAQGQWVTPLRYELLGRYPGRLQRWRRGYRSEAVLPYSGQAGRSYDSSSQPDTAYMLCRRAGKYGFVSRRSGLEVIPARYDSVRYHLTDGLACLYRGGQPYVVNARGRELAQGEYRGDWYDYPGRPLHVFRPADARWSAVDTTGRRRLPWLPGNGYLTPDGRGVVREPRLPPVPGLDWRAQERPCSGVVDSLGRVVVRFREQAGYSGPLPALYRPSDPDGGEPGPLRQGVRGPGPACYIISGDSGRQYLLRARDLRPLLPEAFSAARPAESEAGPAGLQVLPGGWHAGRRLRDGRSVLISPAGRQYAAPAGTGWQREYRPSADYSPGVPFARGVEKVHWGGRGWNGPDGLLNHGYVTPGGRQLWQDQPAAKP